MPKRLRAIELQPRAGTEGVSLASGVLEPALAAVSQEFGATLVADGGSRAGPAARAALADPIKVEAPSTGRCPRRRRSASAPSTPRC